MKTNSSTRSLALWAGLSLLCLATTASAEQFGLFSYRILSSPTGNPGEALETVQITSYPEDATGEVVIPTRIADKPVTSIGYDAFRSCRSLTSVTIPEGVTRIGGCAFLNCSGLTSVTIPISVTNIGESAFEDCTGLTSFAIPEGVTTIGEHAFGGCSGLTSFVVAPGNPAYAGADGVLFNKEMTILVNFPAGRGGDYTIPEGVTGIEANVFSGCVGLTSVTIPPSVSHIGYGAFVGCPGLTNISLGEGVTSIGSRAFYGCTGLTMVTIPSSVRTIGGEAFDDCPGLRRVEFLGESPSFGGVWRPYPGNLPGGGYGTWIPFSGNSTTISVAGSPPWPRIVDGFLTIRFDPSYRGFGYRVETSNDLAHWTGEGVTVSGRDADGLVTASVALGEMARYLRLVPRISFTNLYQPTTG